MIEPWTPDDSELARIFATLRSYPRVVLAVSGGSDSVALLHFAVRWSASLGLDAPRLSVATVDHGLRQGSNDDARWVDALARDLGLAASILTWTGDKPRQGIQERARDARYQLLGQHARDIGQGRCAVVTAHTQDDQAETLLMRLARGSGPDGLQGMRPVRQLAEGVDVVRPLLNLSRARLRSFLAANGGAWLEDPSNADQRFERVRLREAAQVLQTVGLSPQMLALSAIRQRRAVEALDASVDDLQRQALNLHGGMFAAIDGSLFHAQPAELRVRLLGRVLAMFGGQSPAADLAQVETLVDRLAHDTIVRTTLGGCEVRACRNGIRIYRERGRAALPAIDLGAGQQTTWDDRFVIRILKAATPLTVRALDQGAVASLRRHARQDLALPSRAAATLPAVWAGNALIAVGGVPAEFTSAACAKSGACVEMRFLFGPKD